MDPKDIPTGIQDVQHDSKKQELVEHRLDIPDPVQQFSDKLKNHGLVLPDFAPIFLTGNKNERYLPPKNMVLANFSESMEVGLESGLVKNKTDPPARGAVPSVVVHHTDHTAAGSGEYGENVPMTLIQVTTAGYRTVTSKFAQASLTSSLATSIAALLLAGTKWKAAAPMLAKAGIIVCGVGVLLDIGKDLPVGFFMGSLSTALLIITVAILSANRSA